MSSELKGNLTEYNNICDEIKRLSKIVSKLRKRKDFRSIRIILDVDKI